MSMILACKFMLLGFIYGIYTVVLNIHIFKLPVLPSILELERKSELGPAAGRT